MVVFILGQSEYDTIFDLLGLLDAESSLDSNSTNTNGTSLADRKTLIHDMSNQLESVKASIESRYQDIVSVRVVTLISIHLSFFFLRCKGMHFFR